MTEQERAVFDALAAYRKSGSSGYFVALTARPQAVGYGLTDSPAGLAAFFLWHPGFAQWTYGADPGEPKTIDEVLDDITLYGLTGTAVSSGRLYWENRGASPTSATAMKTAQISVPMAVTVFPDDVYRPPQTWVRRAYPTSPTFTRSAWAATSPPGNSRNSSATRSGPRSGRSASRLFPGPAPRRPSSGPDRTTACTIWSHVMKAAEQFHVDQVLPSYWRVTFDNGPVNLLDPDTVDQLGKLRQDALAAGRPAGICD
jgi:hypothetical protein